MDVFSLAMFSVSIQPPGPHTGKTYVQSYFLIGIFCVLASKQKGPVTSHLPAPVKRSSTRQPMIQLPSYFNMKLFAPLRSSGNGRAVQLTCGHIHGSCAGLPQPKGNVRPKGSGVFRSLELLTWSFCQHSCGI